MFENSFALNLDVLDIAMPLMDSLDVAKNKVSKSTPHSVMEISKVGRDWLKAWLTQGTLKSLMEFSTNKSEALLLRDIPLETEVLTPSDGFLKDDECILDFDLLLFGLLSIMGIQPFSVKYENKGKIVRNVVPVKSASNTTSSWGSSVEFSWHTDNPNWPFFKDACCFDKCVPPFLAFTAVRNEEKTPTGVVSVDSILSRLPKSVITELSRSAYAFKAPQSNEGFEGDDRVLPVVEMSNKSPLMRFDDNIVTTIDMKSERALAELRKCLSEVEGVDIVLRSGDFFIFKNERVLHRRKAFVPMQNRKFRWLRRVYGYLPSERQPLE